MLFSLLIKVKEIGETLMDRTKASAIVEFGSPETGSHQVAKACIN